jgi:hypothetical protein
MIGCRFRGIYGTYKPRLGVGLGKGSHSPFQRLVEPLAHTCAKSKRTYGLCTSQCSMHVHGVAGRQRLHLAERRGTPCPPPPHRSGRGSISIFPHFFLGDFPLLFNDNDVKDFYDDRQRDEAR